jgi:magnesium chelatase family protein
LPVRAKSWRNWKRASPNWKSTKSKTDRVAVAVVKSRALAGMDAPEVVVEAHLANGLPAFTLVGLPETEVKEARDRVRAAIQNARFEFPARRITVNLAPADLPKESGRFDLPIALAILAASGQIPQDKFRHAEFAGELALTGELRAVRGALAMALATRGSKHLKLILPTPSASEAALAAGVEVLGAGSLLEVCAWLAGKGTLADPGMWERLAQRRTTPTLPTSRARPASSGRSRSLPQAAIRC